MNSILIKDIEEALALIQEDMLEQTTSLRLLTDDKATTMIRYIQNRIDSHKLKIATFIPQHAYRYGFHAYGYGLLKYYLSRMRKVEKLKKQGIFTDIDVYEVFVNDMVQKLKKRAEEATKYPSFDSLNFDYELLVISQEIQKMINREYPLDYNKRWSRMQEILSDFSDPKRTYMKKIIQNLKQLLNDLYPRDDRDLQQKVKDLKAIIIDQHPGKEKEYALDASRYLQLLEETENGTNTLVPTSAEQAIEFRQHVKENPANATSAGIDELIADTLTMQMKAKECATIISENLLQIKKMFSWIKKKFNISGDAFTELEQFNRLFYGLEREEMLHMVETLKEEVEHMDSEVREVKNLGINTYKDESGLVDAVSKEFEKVRQNLLSYVDFWYTLREIMVTRYLDSDWKTWIADTKKHVSEDILLLVQNIKNEEDILATLPGKSTAQLQVRARHLHPLQNYKEKLTKRILENHYQIQDEIESKIQEFQQEKERQNRREVDELANNIEKQIKAQQAKQLQDQVAHKNRIEQGRGGYGLMGRPRRRLVGRLRRQQTDDAEPLLPVSQSKRIEKKTARQHKAEAERAEAEMAEDERIEKETARQHYLLSQSLYGIDKAEAEPPVRQSNTLRDFVFTDHSYV